MHIPCLLMTMLAASLAVNAQSTSAITAGSMRQVYNEDRGRACILTGGTQPKPLNQKALNATPTQFSVFYGSGWKSDALRQREPDLANLLAGAYRSGRVGVLSQYGLAGTLAGDNYAEIGSDNGSRGDLSDLKVQALIGSFIRQGARAGQDEQKTFVIYLDPTIGSTLAEMTGGKHYLAYHNEFNVSGKRVRYVVVPFEEDAAVQSQTAFDALMSAVYDPGCGT